MPTAAILGIEVIVDWDLDAAFLGDRVERFILGDQQAFSGFKPNQDPTVSGVQGALYGRRSERRPLLVLQPGKSVSHLLRATELNVWTTPRLFCDSASMSTASEWLEQQRSLSQLAVQHLKMTPKPIVAGFCDWAPLAFQVASDLRHRAFHPTCVLISPSVRTLDPHRAARNLSSYKTLKAGSAALALRYSREITDNRLPSWLGFDAWTGRAETVLTMRLALSRVKIARPAEFQVVVIRGTDSDRYGWWSDVSETHVRTFEVEARHNELFQSRETTDVFKQITNHD